MISFGARYISPAIVQKVMFKDAKVLPEKVSFIEFNPKDSVDLEAVYDVSEAWKTKDPYPAMIYSYMSYCATCKAEEESENTKFYALTTQKDNFEKPEAEDIIALAQVNTAESVTDGTKDVVEIEYLQAKPESPLDNYFKPYKFKHIGTGILDVFKKIFKGRKLVLYSNPMACDFYLKNGFTQEDAVSAKFIYNA